MTKHVRGNSQIVRSTIVSLLRTRAEQQPDDLAYQFASDDGEEQVTYAELDRRARAIGGILRGLRMRGAPLLLLYPPGIDYIAALFGCMYAGAIAVPASPPDPLRPHRFASGLAAIVRDAGPRAVLTTAEMSAALRAPLALTAPRLRVVTTDDESRRSPGAWEPAPPEAESVALLQYTSGSAAAPKGVALTHRNLMSNSELILRYFRHSRESRGLNWLAQQHYMGLVGGILQPLYAGFPMTMMAPADFVRRPLRWLQEISRIGATTTGGPNFAYDLCIRHTIPEEREQLDLSSWQVAFNGGEPVRAQTMERFARAFEPAGFRREAFHPCYGLAEATHIVTADIPWPRRGARSFDAVNLRYGKAVPCAPDTKSRRLVACGYVSAELSPVVIVDPSTRLECPVGHIGEIWVSGSCVGKSYWRRPEETRRVFGATLDDTGEGPFMRTGDLGFMLDDQLFVTGRITDLIIAHGHHHPQDIEWTAERSSPVLRRGGSAAFSVSDGDHERVIVVCEVNRPDHDTDAGAVTGAVRTAVAREHEIPVHTIVLVPPGAIPKTPSGKVQRSLCAAMLENGQFTEIGRSTMHHAAGTGHPASHAKAYGTLGQRSLWFIHEKEPGVTQQCIAVALRCSGQLDASTLEHAVDALTARQGAFRVTLRPGDGEPGQRASGSARTLVQEHDVGDIDDARLTEWLEDIVHDLSDPAREPLHRIHLCRRLSGETVVLMVVHRAVADFWSITTLVRELEMLYSEQLTGQPAPLPELADFVRQYSWVGGARIPVQRFES